MYRRTCLLLVIASTQMGSGCQPTIDVTERAQQTADRFGEKLAKVGSEIDLTGNKTLMRDYKTLLDEYQKLKHDTETFLLAGIVPVDRKGDLVFVVRSCTDDCWITVYQDTEEYQGLGTNVLVNQPFHPTHLVFDIGRKYFDELDAEAIRVSQIEYPHHGIYMVNKWAKQKGEIDRRYERAFKASRSFVKDAPPFAVPIRNLTQNERHFVSCTVTPTRENWETCEVLFTVEEWVTDKSSAPERSLGIKCDRAKGTSFKDTMLVTLGPSKNADNRSEPVQTKAN